MPAIRNVFEDQKYIGHCTEQQKNESLVIIGEMVRAKVPFTSSALASLFCQYFCLHLCILPCFSLILLFYGQQSKHYMYITLSFSRSICFVLFVQLL